MRAAWRFLLIAAAVVLVVGVVLVGAVMVTVLALPVAVALGLALLTLVAGIGNQLGRGPGRRRTRAEPSAPGDEHHAAVPASPTSAARPRWTAAWDTELTADAVPLVRDRLGDVLAEWGLSGTAGEPTLLVVTELMSNAVDHARAPVRLEVGFFDTWVRVEVHDDAPEPPRLRPHDPLRARGRGLQLVDALSSQWGWTRAGTGKVVWADVLLAWPA